MRSSKPNHLEDVLTFAACGWPEESREDVLNESLHTVKILIWAPQAQLMSLRMTICSVFIRKCRLAVQSLVHHLDYFIKKKLDVTIWDAAMSWCIVLRLQGCFNQGLRIL